MEYVNKFLYEDRIVFLVRSGEFIIEEDVEMKDEFIDIFFLIIDDYEEEGYENIVVIFKGKDELK